MKKLVLIFLLFSSYAFAQENSAAIQNKIEMTVGKLVVENAALTITVENLQKQILDLKKQLAEKEKK